MANLNSCSPITSGYHLLPHCFLVEGAKRAAIYDLKANKIFSINEVGKKILKGEQSDEDYWKKLVTLQLAEIGKEKRKLVLKKIAPLLKFMWLEVTGRCNLRCLHCYGRFKDSQVVKENLLDWEDVLKQGRGLGCRAIQFIGGEPLLYPNLGKLIIKAKHLGFKKIEVFTNGTLFNEEWADFFKVNNVFLAISFYSSKADVHDGVTQKKGSFAQTDKAIKLARKKKLKLRVAIIVMKQNQQTLEDTRSYLRSCGISCHPDVVRPTGRGNDQKLLPDKQVDFKYALRTKPSFSTSFSSFSLFSQFNSCWFGKMAVTADGDVIPCIFARNQVAGNVNKQPLKTIIKSMSDKFWKITLDKVEVCQDCEYRFACHNCRPLAEGRFKNLLANNPRCSYNPYTGIWEI